MKNTPTPASPTSRTTKTTMMMMTIGTPSSGDEGGGAGGGDGGGKLQRSTSCASYVQTRTRPTGTPRMLVQSSDDNPDMSDASSSGVVPEGTITSSWATVSSSLKA